VVVAVWQTFLGSPITVLDLAVVIFFKIPEHFLHNRIPMPLPGLVKVDTGVFFSDKEDLLLWFYESVYCSYLSPF